MPASDPSVKGFCTGVAKGSGGFHVKCVLTLEMMIAEMIRDVNVFLGKVKVYKFKLLGRGSNGKVTFEWNDLKYVLEVQSLGIR